MTLDETIAAAVAKLPDGEKRILLGMFGECGICHAPIVRSGGKRKFCLSCAAERVRDQSAKWARETYASVRYEHDAYISKRK